MSALLALRLGNLPLAQQMIARALQLEPDNAFARRVAALVETAAVQR
jgi:hypothetical protein